MPITKQAIKRMKQSDGRRTNNRHYRSHMKSMIKLILNYIDTGEMEKAKKILPDVVRSIDMASKKHIIHDNNAARKKSGVQRAINVGPKPKTEKPAKEKAAKTEIKAKAKTKAKAKATKKEEPKTDE